MVKYCIITNEGEYVATDRGLVGDISNPLVLVLEQEWVAQNLCNYWNQLPAYIDEDKFSVMEFKNAGTQLSE